jgi:hypothetical protein
MELTSQEIDRQDFVDNSIYQLLETLNPTKKQIEWDIDAIGEVRDKIQTIFLNLNICDEKTFYPYLRE